MLIVAGTLTIEAGHRDRFLESVADMVVATRAEAGCRDYVFSPDPDDETVIRLFEVWDSDEALAGHLASDHMAAWRARAAELPLTGRDITKYDIASSGPLG